MLSEHVDANQRRLVESLRRVHYQGKALLYLQNELMAAGRRKARAAKAAANEEGKRQAMMDKFALAEGDVATESVWGYGVGDRAFGE